MGQNIFQRIHKHHQTFSQRRGVLLDQEQQAAQGAVVWIHTKHCHLEGTDNRGMAQNFDHICHMAQQDATSCCIGKQNTVVLIKKNVGSLGVLHV